MDKPLKTIFDAPTRQALIQRIESLSEHNPAVWGKMNAYQMVQHCIRWDEWMLGTHSPAYKQAFIGRLFGKVALHRMVKDDKPIDRNVPTSTWLKIKETTGDFQQAKSQWASLVDGYGQYDNPAFIHDFFGKMTRGEIGILAYKHTDHHLRQFGA